MLGYVVPLVVPLFPSGSAVQPPSAKTRNRNHQPFIRASIALHFFLFAIAMLGRMLAVAGAVSLA